MGFGDCVSCIVGAVSEAMLISRRRGCGGPKVGCKGLCGATVTVIDYNIPQYLRRYRTIPYHTIMCRISACVCTSVVHVTAVSVL